MGLVQQSSAVSIDDRDSFFFQTFNSDDDVTIIDDSFNDIDNSSTDVAVTNIDAENSFNDGSFNSDDDVIAIDADNSFNTQEDNDVVAIQDNDTFTEDNDSLVVNAEDSFNDTEQAAPAAVDPAAAGTRPRGATCRRTSGRRTPGRGAPGRGTRGRGDSGGGEPARRALRRDRRRPGRRPGRRHRHRARLSAPSGAAVNRTEPLAVVDKALAAIARYERPDLDDRLRNARTRLLDDRVRVLVVGEFKQGKSMLVNGLVGAPVCPTFDDVATAVPTRVRHADKVTITLVRELDPAGTDPAHRRTERIEVPAEKLVDHVCEQGNPGNREGWSHVEVAVPRPVLAGGLELVDTPGVGGLQSVHGAATMAALPAADAVLLVSDAAQEYTAPELEFLAHAASVCPNVACVVTKTDLYPEWRRIVELNRGHLATTGITAELFPVSSTLRWSAVLENDAELNTESGFPELISYVRKRVLGQADRLARRGVVHDVLAVTDQLAGNLRSEQSAQQNPEDAQRMLRTLTAAQERAAALKERSARWQQTLNDGVADLNADIDYDLRDRMREISRMAEDELLGGGDPSKVWEQFAGWVQQEVASAASANFLWATQRVRWLAHQVAEHFSSDGDQLLPALRNDPSDALRSVRAMAAPEGGPTGLGTKALTAMKGGYGGLLMFGMVGTFVGFASIINPLGIGAAIMMGGKTVGDERKRMITKRQNEAKAAVRRYVDDVTFQVAKDSRDRLRAVQRDLRDHFTAQAEQMKRSLLESQQAAERAVKASRSEREARLTQITAALEQLEAVRRQARALLSQPAAAARPEQRTAVRAG